MSAFWDAVDAALPLLQHASSAEAVLELCPGDVSDGFWPGDGDELLNALHAAGWSVPHYEATYLWTARAPDGSGLSYTEGDLGLLPTAEQP